MADSAYIKETRKKHKKTLLVVGSVLLVLVAGGAGAGLRWWQNHNKIVPPAMVADYSQDKALSGDLEGGQTEIDKALKREDITAEDKYLLYYQKGTNFQNQNENEKALAEFKTAATYKQTYSLYNSMGMAAETLGDIPGAIDYYKKALQQIDASTKTISAEEDKKSLQFKIDYLSKQQ